MVRRVSVGGSGGISVGRILGVLVPVVALAFLVLQQANFLVGRSLLIAFGDAESTYRNAWFELDGDVVAKDLVVYPYAETRDVALRFDTVHLETPGWLWFVRNTFDRRLDHARFERLHLTLGGVTSSEGVDPTLGDLGPFGAASASPFEAQGCLDDDMWVRSELEQMGLSPGLTTLGFDYRVDGKQLLTSIVLKTPGVSTARLERREQLPAEVNALLLDQSPSLVQFERWQVQDQGFVKARNAWCAKQDGIHAPAFVARHVESVARLLETIGLAADQPAIDAYRGFATEGGEFAFGGEYPQPLRSDQLYAARENGVALLRMHGLLERGGQRLAVQWRRFDPKPLQGLDKWTTYAALQKERGLDPFAARTARAAEVAGITAATAPRASSIASRTGGAPLASSLPTASTLAPPGSRLPWNELTRYRGRVMQIWTAHNPPRTVTLLDANAGELSVKAHLTGGSALYRIARGAFLRATLIQ